MAATLTHGAAVVLQAFADVTVALNDGQRAPELEQLARVSAYASFATLCDVFALTSLSTHGLLLLLDAGVLPPGALGRLDAALSSACARVRPHAVPLTDAFSHHDDELGSALGSAEDGKVVPALTQYAASEPLNCGAASKHGGGPSAGTVSARELTLLRQAAEAGLSMYHRRGAEDGPRL